MIVADSKTIIKKFLDFDSSIVFSTEISCQPDSKLMVRITRTYIPCNYILQTVVLMEMAWHGICLHVSFIQDNITHVCSRVHLSYLLIQNC